MGFRYSKSIRLGKHIRLNVSKSGVGVSAGVKGLRVSTGPRGSYLTASIPGTGLSYSKKLGNAPPRSSARQQSPARKAAAPPALPAAAPPAPPSHSHPIKVSRIPDAGLFAPKHEKEFVKALRDYETGNHRAALHHFVAAVHQEPGAGLLAATIYARHEQGIKQAVMLLEAIVQAEIEFPTPLMKKYLVDHVQVQLDVTPNITVTVPADGLLATLLLVELYQDQGRMEEAIGLLEEIEELSGEPVVTLSLCELYAYEGIWDGIIERGQGIPVEDDITLEISVFYGRAMQEKGLHDAALQVFGAALKKKKGYNPMLLREATYWRAVSYQKLGKKRQAHKAFQKLYAETPDFRDVAERVTLPL